MLDPHIVKSYDEQLLKLHNIVNEMGELALRQFDASLKALVDRDPAQAAQAIDTESRIDTLEHAANEQVVRLLALRAPVADDLRVVVTGLKIASTLESIADYAASIAERALQLAELSKVPSTRSLNRMAGLVHELLGEVMEAYRSNDFHKALEVWHRDKEVDAQYSSLFRELLTYMMEDTRNVASCSHLMFVAKHVERIGDLTTNIGEMVYFLSTGETLTGERPKGDTSSFDAGDGPVA